MKLVSIFSFSFFGFCFFSACTSTPTSRSVEHDDVYFTPKDYKAHHIKRNPAYDVAYVAPPVAPAVADPNEYYFPSTPTPSAAPPPSSSVIVRKKERSTNRLQTNYSASSSIGPGSYMGNTNSFNFTWYFSNYYGYNQMWQPYRYTPYYYQTFINPYNNYWNSPMGMSPFYNGYGCASCCSWNNPYAFTPPIYYQPSYINYPSYYTPQTGNVIVAPTSTQSAGPKPMVGTNQATYNPTPPSVSTTPSTQKTYTPAPTSPKPTYPSGQRSSGSATSTQQAQRSYVPPTHTPTPAPNRSYTPPQRYTPPQNNYTPPQQSYTPPQQTYTPPQRSYTPPSGGGTSGTPNPRAR